ncbi:MAG: VCBS repeat-containing protein [Calditrichaceae bacterium]|nr:VCBS repeat-containing protein [Calditrichaceae bacterium]
MKIQFTLSIIFIILLCLSSIVFAQLNGSYTIGSTGDFADFTEAVDSLESQGVDGPVVFDVQDGIYEEQIDIDAISGSSEANQIVFQSLAEDSSQVILKYAAAGADDNYVIKLSGGSHIIFKQMTIRTGKGMYANGVVLEDNSSHIRFLNCLLKGNYHSDNSARYHLVSLTVPHVHYISFEYCRMDSAGAAISLSSGDAANPIQGVYITNNQVTNVGYAAINLNQSYYPQIRSNQIQANSVGIKMSSGHGQSIIEKNRIYSNSSGMELNLNGYAGYHALITNNFIISGEQDAMSVQGQYIDIYNNSIYSNSYMGTTSALDVYGTVNTYGINIVNNNICRMRAGKALTAQITSGINDCRNNNFYTPGNTFAYWDSVDCDDLAELQLKSEKNENSLSVYPHYLSTTDLHTMAPWLDGKGIPLTEITDDIDGEDRDAGNPDIGADEFTADPLTTTPLAGSYSIGGATYPAIQDAIDDAVLKGISAPVTFNIQTGIYNEQVNVYSIPGASAVKRVTFRSATGDTSDVWITFTSIDEDSNYVIRNFGADFITYEGLTLEANNATYGRALDLYQGSDSIEVRGCHLMGSYNTNARESLALLGSTDSYFRERIIEGNTFENSAYAMYVRRDSWQWKHSQSAKILNNTIINCGYTAFYIQFYDGLTINNNTINSGSYGVYCISSDNAAEILNNRIILNIGGGGGIVLSSCLASDLNRGLIANNFVSCLTNSGVSGIKITNGSHYDVYYNSVSINSANSESIGFEIASGSSQDINVINNNFSCLKNGYTFSIADAAFVNSFDYNNFYSPSNFLARYDGSFYYDLDFVKRYSGTNAHSLSVYPHYISETDLHTIAPWLDNKGLPLDSVSVDINGDIRDLLHPDIGADEFTADPTLTTPLHGTITIGSGGDYTNIQDAFDDALLKGVSDAVTFNILPGTYHEQISITSIPGTSPINNITIRSQTGDTSDVEITYTASDQNNNYVIRFYGADFINLENLKLTANGSTYARVIDFYLGADSIALRNNSFSSVYNTNASVDRAIIYSPDAYYFSRIIENNVFYACSYGIYMRAVQNNVPYPLGAVIHNNQLINCSYAGMYIQFYDAPHITGNEVHAHSYGIEALTCINELKILNNKISAGSQSGLYVASCDAGQYHHGLVANNFINVGGASVANGLNVTSSSYQDIVHNSVNITSTHTTNGRALNINSGNNLFFKNNILVNNGGGYAYYNASPSAVAESDYNDIYTTGSNLAYWNGIQTDLSALQSESSMDANSLSIDPGYTSDTDLHIASETLDGAGTPVPEVDVDIDLQPRHPVTPDIGADEYRTGPNNPPYVASAIPDQVFDEDTSPHTIAALQVVFTDDDPDDYLTFEVTDYPGVVATKANDTLVINLATNYYGVGMIYVTATDLGGLSAVDSFLVTVNPVPDPPVAMNDETSLLTNAAVTMYPLENDSDVDSDELTIIRITDPPNGTATILPGDTSISYMPDLNFFGSDSFRYVIQDETTLDDSAWVFLTITNIFSEAETPFAQLSNSVVLAGDYDNDKDLDVFICGTEDGAHNISQLYRNSGGVFSATQSFLGLMPDNPQGAAWCDYNNDGNIDLIISGIVDNTPTEVRTVVYTNDGGVFTLSDIELTNMWNGSITCADIDNDGDQDLLMMGNQSNDPYDPVTKLWRNDGSDGADGWTFTDITDDQFPDLNGGSAAWADFDKDGDLDVAIMGMLSLGSPYFDIYKNEGGSFAAFGLELTQIGYGQLMWGDYDADGDPDLLFSGETTGLFQMRNGIVRNDGSDVFTELHPFDSWIGLGSSWWVDYDSDGDLDAFFTGVDSLFGRQSVAYANKEGTFELAAVSLPPISHGSMGWGDYNDDGKIDVILTGMGASSSRKSVLMQNNHPNSNIAPEAPTIYSTGNNENTIRLYWHRPSDDHTASKALTYNVSVGIASNDMSIASPMSHLDDGSRKVVTPGFVTQDTTWQIKGLTSGRLYTFSVQAIDAAYKGSPFYTTYIAPQNNYFMERYHQIPGFMQGDAKSADFSGDQDYDLLITGMTYEDEHATNLIQGQGPLYAPIENNLPAPSDRGSLDWKDFDGDSDPDILISGLDPSGVHDYMNDIYICEEGNYTLLDPGIDGIMRGDTKWFDYDNDGDLDIITSGFLNTMPVTKLFENQGGGYVETDDEFIGAQNSSIDIADYDHDGDMDILLTGAISEIPYRLTAIYRNEGDGFIEISGPFAQVSHGCAKWGDYDMDGDMDILLTGEIFDGGRYTGIYRNVNGQWFETPDTSVLLDVRYSSAAWGDLDNDGDLDCIISGLEYIDAEWQPATRLYLNNDNHFVDLDLYLSDQFDGNIVLADFFKDFKLDIFQCGSNRDRKPESKLYWNRTSIENTPPLAPSNLNAVVNDSIVTFSWDASTDIETATEGLTYNLRIGSQPLHSDIKMCQSDTSGFRIVPEFGNVGAVTEWKLNIAGLEGGIYWSVQAVDNSFVGSLFATEQYINLTDILAKEDFLPKKFALYQNYPNPFNPSTKIKFDVPASTDVKIVLYNILGEKVQTLVNKKYTPGRHEYVMDGSGLAAGLYFYRIKTDTYTNTKRMILLK